MTERFELIRNMPTTGQTILSNYSNPWMLVPLLIFCVLLVALITGQLTRVLSESANSFEKVTVPDTSSNGIQPPIDKPLVLPQEETSAGTAQGNTKVDLNVQSSDPGSTSGSVTINGETTQLSGNDSIHKEMSSNESGTTSVDISVSSDSAGISSSRLNIQSNSSSEIDMKSQ